MSEPVVEILMATYNGEAYLRAQLDSILNQTEKRWRLTISDDGSTDATPAIIDEYVNRYPDKIRRIRAKTRFGNARDHFFWLMRQSNSDHIAFCDQDDVWLKGKLERLMAAMLAAQARLGSDTPILVFSDQTVTDERLNTIAPSLMRYQKQYFERFDFRSILMQNVVTGGAMMINRALARLAGRCADTSQVIMHDWWLAAVAARFGEIVYIDEPLGAYRQHGGNSVGAKDVGSVSHVINRLRHMDDLKETIRAKKRQAAELQKTFGERMSKEDTDFILGFERNRSGISFYLANRKYIHGIFRLAGMMLLG